VKLVAVVAIAIALCPAIAAADDDDADDGDRRPSGWLVRATPGFGFARDGMTACQMEGRMFVGGFSAARFVAPGVALGATLSLAVNTLPDDETCAGGDPGLVLGALIGGLVEWYPSGALGLHLAGGFGYAEIDHQGTELEMDPGRGVGGLVAIGYDWEVTRNTIATRIGVRFQVTGLRTFTAQREHATLIPALLVTFGFD
jgi:hypothetical protein